jgi:hypothetical protein
LLLIIPEKITSSSGCIYSYCWNFFRLLIQQNSTNMKIEDEEIIPGVPGLLDLKMNIETLLKFC